MKRFMIFLALFNFGFIISAVAMSSHDNFFSPADTILTGSEKSYTPDFYNNIDYSIQIKNSTGTIVNLETWRGKSLLLIFAHSDCSFCKSLVKKYETELQDTTLNVLVLFSGSDTSEINEFRQETSLKYPYYVDYAFQFKRKYGAPVVPVTFYLNSNGTAIRIAGMKKKAVEDLINKLNKG